MKTRFYFKSLLKGYAYIGKTSEFNVLSVTTSRFKIRNKRFYQCLCPFTHFTLVREHLLFAAFCWWIHEKRMVHFFKNDSRPIQTKVDLNKNHKGKDKASGYLQSYNRLQALFLPFTAPFEQLMPSFLMQLCGNMAIT